MTILLEFFEKQQELEVESSAFNPSKACNFNPSKAWNFNPSKAWNFNLYDSLFTFFRRVEIKKTNKRKADDSNFGNWKL